MTGRTTVDLLDDAAARHPDREAFVDGDRRLTFAELHRAAGAVAAALAARGVGKGDVVCVRLPSSIEYAVCYHAAMRLGAVTSGVNTRLGAREVDSILRRTDPKVVVEDAAEVRAWSGEDPVGPAPGLDPRDPVAIVWTSGTTGEPKGAVFDHANLEAMARGAGVLSEDGDRRLSPLPFAHVGYMTRAWDELARGITTVITPTPWKAADALALIERERVTVGQGVPAQWALMLAHDDFEGTDVSSLRIAATGAAPVPPDLVREMRRRLGVPVVVRYASTEASLATGTRIGDADDVVAWTVGRPGDGVELRIAGADESGVGEVHLRSGAMMRGYWQDPERTAEVIGDDGWLRTGDLGRLDDGGNLVLAGRRTEMYLRGGYNVYPVEVEAVLAEHPAVDRVAVVGVPDPVLGQLGAAFVVAAAGATVPDADELRRWCKERLADYKAPDQVHVVDDLPLTSMSKIDKRALLERLATTGGR